MEKLRVLLLFSVVSLCLLNVVHGQAVPERPSDDLLADPALQVLVDAQVERDEGPLREALMDPAPRVRARAAFALGSVQDSAAADDLLEHLDDPDPRVRADAGFALGQLGRPSQVPQLLDRLETETDPAVQRELLYAIGKLGDANTLDALVDLSLDPDREAARALTIGRFGIRGVSSDAGITYLLRQLAHEQSDVRRHAAYYFARLADPAPWRPQAATLRDRLDALSPGDPAAMHLLRGLARLQEPSDSSHFSHWLQHGSDWRTRVEAARGLGSLEAHLELLAHALDAPSPHVARAAAEALSASSPWPRSLLGRLKAWTNIHADNWPVTSALLPGFAAHGETEVLSNYLEAWQDEPPAYAAGVEALRAARPGYAFERLMDGLQHPSPLVASASASSLSAHLEAPPVRERAEDVFERLREALARGETGVIYAVAPLLTNPLFPRSSSSEALAQAYGRLAASEVGARMALLEALAATETETAEAVHRRALGAAHPLEREVAARGLTELTGSSVSASLDAAPAERAVDWAYLAERGSHPHLVLETEHGLVTIRLFTEQAPLTVQTIIQLAEAGAYDGVPFHRVIPNFVAQGGDVEGGLGFGGPGYDIRSEFTRLRYTRGTVGMASVGKDSEGSQFFITHSMQPHLDGAYTAFGRVVDGMDAADAIGPFDLLLRATVEPDPEAGQ